MVNLRAYWSAGLSLMLVVALCFASLLLVGSRCWSASEGESGLKTAAATRWVQGEVMKYAAKRYAVVGPLSVSSVDPTFMGLFTGLKPMQIRLDKKKVTVKDHDGKKVSLEAVKKGNRVYVCRKGNEVIILVLEHTKPPQGDKALD
jgi:hypothetical protein